MGKFSIRLVRNWVVIFMLGAVKKDIKQRNLLQYQIVKTVRLVFAALVWLFYVDATRTEIIN